MQGLQVTILDAAGQRRQATLPGSVAVARVIAKLVMAMGLPTVQPDGAWISYRLHHQASGRQLGATETLVSAQVKDGDVLRLTPEILAG